MIRIHTLGAISVTRDGKPLSGVVTQPRSLAVLVLIARTGERGISRDKLVALLWPDSDVESGRASLSRALSTLRRELGDSDLFTGVQALRLNQATAACDVLDFEAALSAGQLERAVALFEGPFLEGFRVPGADGLDRWIEEEQAELATRYAEVLEQLGREASERGDVVTAVSWWRKRAGLDPLNARVTLELMRALAAAGERHAAIQQARIYEVLLEQELSVAPDAEVVRFAAALRNAAATVPSVVNSTPAAVAPATEPVAALSSSPSSPASPASPTPAVRRRTLVSGLALALLAAVVLVAVFLSRRSAARPSVPVLAVGQIGDYRGGGSETAAPLSDMLATNLARIPGLQVISSMRLLELAARHPNTDGTTALAAAAREAGASQILEGGLHALDGGRLLLELRRVDLADGAVRSAWRLEGNDLFDLVASATGEVSTSLGYAETSLHPGDVSTRSLVSYRFYEEGMQSFVRGDFRTAHRLFDAALAEDSNFAMAAYYRWLAKAPIGMAQLPGEVERVSRLADRATERERLLIRGFVAISTQAPDLLAIAETLAVRYPAEVDGHYLLGLGRQVQGEYALAIPHFRRVLELDSTAVGSAGRCRWCDALQQLSHSYQALDSLATAETLVRGWIARDSSTFRPWIPLASLLAVTNRPGEALQAWRRATITPTNLYDEIFPSSVQIVEGDFAAADQLLQSLRRSSRTVASQAVWQLGISLRYQARWDEALALLRSRSAELTDAERDRDFGYLPKLAEGLVLFEAGRRGQAIRLWDSIARHPNPILRQAERVRRQTYLYVLMTEAAAGEGDTLLAGLSADSAQAWGARGGNPRDLRMALHARGLALLAKGDTSQAIDTLAHAIFSPTVGFTRSNLWLGRLLLARGRPADAIGWLRPALRGTLEGPNLYVTRTEIHEELARGFDAIGQSDSARTHWTHVARALARSDAGARQRLERATTGQREKH